MDKGYLKLLGLEYYEEKHFVRSKSKLCHDIDWVVKSLGVSVQFMEGDELSKPLMRGKRVVIPKRLGVAEKQALFAHLLKLQEKAYG